MHRRDPAQHLDHRVLHVRFHEVHDRVVLDGAIGPAAAAQELVQAVLVKAQHDVVPGRRALGRDSSAHAADGVLPQVIRRPAALVIRDAEPQARRVGVRVRHRHPFAADVDQPPGVAHRERSHRQAELRAVGQCQVVGLRDAHATRLGIQPRREGAQRPDPATDPVLRLQHDRPMTLPPQLVRGDQTRQAATDDDHVAAWRGTGLQTERCRSQHVPRDGRRAGGVRLPGLGVDGRVDGQFAVHGHCGMVASPVSILRMICSGWPIRHVGVWVGPQTGALPVVHRTRIAESPDDARDRALRRLLRPCGIGGPHRSAHFR